MLCNTQERLYLGGLAYLEVESITLYPEGRSSNYVVQSNADKILQACFHFHMTHHVTLAKSKRTFERI